MTAVPGLNVQGGPESSDASYGFFTDTSVCIGCKACEVACKEWNGVPGKLTQFSGNSYDNTGELSANAWRHVAFVEQAPATVGLEWFEGERWGAGQATQVGGARWLMSSDVCKHCTEAGCLEVCPTGAIFRTEFSTVVIQDDVCNGCGYCVVGCPFGVITIRTETGGAYKCTLCYDRMRGGLQPACAQACPTDSIQFGPLDELRQRAAERLEAVRATGEERAQLYGHDPEDGIGGAGCFFLLLDDPEVYRLPPDPVTPTRDLPSLWGSAAAAAGVLVAGVAAIFSLGTRQ
jgi:formate dehydrogenase iron-sulfur subunit